MRSRTGIYRIVQQEFPIPFAEIDGNHAEGALPAGELDELLQGSVPFGVLATADGTEIFNEILFLDTFVQETIFLIMHRYYPFGENRLCELVNVFVVVLFHLRLRVGIEKEIQILGLDGPARTLVVEGRIVSNVKSGCAILQIMLVEFYFCCHITYLLALPAFRLLLPAKESNIFVKYCHSLGVWYEFGKMKNYNYLIVFDLG